MTEKQLYDALDPLIKKKYEKRFVRSVCGIDDLLQKKRYIYDLKETEGAMLDLIELLNELYDENQQLKAKVDDKDVAVEVETCKVMEKIFDLLDKKIQEVKEKYPNPLYDRRYYHGRYDAFKELKKELTE